MAASLPGTPQGGSYGKFVLLAALSGIAVRAWKMRRSERRLSRVPSAAAAAHPARPPAALPASLRRPVAASRPFEADSAAARRSLPRRLWALARDAVVSWSDDYAPSMGAALAYYTLFSIAPMLLIVISLAGLLFGQDAARGEIFAQLAGLMGEQGAQAIETLLESLRQPSQGGLGALFGFGVWALAATTVFGELQDALDRIWRAPVRTPGGGLWGLVRSRLLSFGMVMAVGFMLIVSLVLSAALAALGRWWGPMFGTWETLAQGVNLVVSFGLTTVAFAMIYKFIPRVQVHWRDVWIGAAVTAALFSIGKLLIGLYIGKSSMVSGLAAASSIVVLLIWVYYSAQIFLLGAEFTWVYAHTFGSRHDQPRPGAAEAAPCRNPPPSDTPQPERRPP